MSKPRLYISVINDLSGDQRIHRIASTLSESGFEVCVVGRRQKSSLPLSERPYRTHRMRLLLEKGKWFYLEFNLRLFWFLLFRKVDILNSNDLDTLLPNYLVSRLRRKKLVYDSHEYFTEVPELVHRPRTRSIWLWLEKRLFPKLKQVYTVNGSLAKAYQDRYGVPVKVVRNVPFSKPFPDVGEKENILLYQGALNLGRGIDLMIQAMAHLPHCKLWILGKGDVEAELKALTSKLGLEDRVAFLGFKPLEALASITPQAKIGFSIEEDLGANYHFASPNKVYDYIQAGVPVIVADLPEMAALVQQYKVGSILKESERNPETLARLVEQMLNDPVQYARWVKACKAAATELNWENERAHLLSIYQALNS